MTTKVTLHIGTPKTGTTAIQVLLAKNQELLKSFDVDYPNLTNSGFGWPIERGVSSGNADMTWGYSWPDGNKNNRVKWLIEKGIEKSKPDSHIVLSSELLSWLAVNEEFWKVLNEVANDQGCEIKVVGYLRDPFSYFLSAYKQAVKADGFSGQLADYIDTFCLTDFPLSFNFQKNISSIHIFAEKHNIELKLFRYENSADSIEEHFIANVLKLDPSTLEMPDQPINMALSAEIIQFHRGVNHVSRKMGQLLGFERSDVKLSAMLPPRNRTNTKLFLDSSSQKRLNDFFAIYKDQVTGILDFADEINFTVNSNYVTDSISERELEIIDEIFNIGMFVGASFEGGYLEWGWENDRKLKEKAATKSASEESDKKTPFQ
jgi:hypothetical protein